MSTNLVVPARTQDLCANCSAPVEGRHAFGCPFDPKPLRYQVERAKVNLGPVNLNQFEIGLPEEHF